MASIRELTNPSANASPCVLVMGIDTGEIAEMARMLGNFGLSLPRPEHSAPSHAPLVPLPCTSPTSSDLTGYLIERLGASLHVPAELQLDLLSSPRKARITRAVRRRFEAAFEKEERAICWADRRVGVPGRDALCRSGAEGEVREGAHREFAYEPGFAESPWTTELLRREADAEQLARAAAVVGRRLRPAGEGARPGEVVGPDQEAPAPCPYPLNATEDEDRYRRWVRERGERTELPVTGPMPTPATKAPRHSARAGGGRRAPMFSVVVPCYRPVRFALDRCVASVLDQDFADWELAICDDASGDRELAAHLSAIERLDPRICVSLRSENGGISAATNDAIGRGSGRYVVFLDHDDELHPAALSVMAAAVADHDGAVLLYSDEDKIDAAGRRQMPSFKPDWSPDLLLSNAYMCHLLVVERATLEAVGGLRSELDGAQDYDLMLRVSELAEGAGRAIVHVPEVL
ncbi:MAG: glycosyltransferase family 2 protein, partial [Acidimicrobiales bacterium]